MSAWSKHSALLAEYLHEQKHQKIRMAMVDRGVPNDPLILEATYHGQRIAWIAYPHGVEVFELDGVPLLMFGPPTIAREDGQVKASQACFFFLR